MGTPVSARLEQRTFRRHTVRVGLAALWALPAVFRGVFALDLGPPPKVDDPMVQLVYGAIALPFAVLAVRTGRIGVFTGPGGVRVRGVLRTRTLCWGDIAGFEMGMWPRSKRYRCGIVRRRDGAQITVLALNPPYELKPGTDPRVAQLLAALDEELRKARGAGPGDVALEHPPVTLPALVP